MSAALQLRQPPFHPEGMADAAPAALDSAQLLVEATRRSVAGGERINLDVLQAQQQLFDAQRTLAQARYNHLLSLIRLRFAAGVLQMSEDGGLLQTGGGGGVKPLARPPG